MDAGLRLAWTQIVTGEDYDDHMARVGQAEAGADLSRRLILSANPPAGGRVVVAGAGTGQMLDFVDPALLRPYLLTFSDLNPAFLARHGLAAAVLVDDIEQTKLEPAPDFLLAALLLEHIDWRRGVQAIAGLRPPPAASSCKRTQKA